MKYMGSKRTMLRNGLGELLISEVPGKRRFFDIFCGTGSVAGHVAQLFEIPVHASDLQEYAVALAAAQVQQIDAFDSDSVFQEWLSDAELSLITHADLRDEAIELSTLNGSFESMRDSALRARCFCAGLPSAFPLSIAYGGYYFSPFQAMVLDSMRACLPTTHSVATLAALISAASSCAASPGHTAQPFATTDSALPHLRSAWSRDMSENARSAITRTACGFARTQGRAFRADALTVTKEMSDGDLVFIDPPYSEVQYSRFYHVLESVARGNVGEVTGVGRYESIEMRPQSLFCRVTQSKNAFEDLMAGIASSGADAIVTFPAGTTSNGLSGTVVEQISDCYFNVRKKKVSSIFSTMGGDAQKRDARKAATELILYLSPR